MPNGPLWLWPTLMVVKNVVVLVSALVFEGRIKPTVAVYIVRYACTIPAARRGDIGPFLMVLNS